MNDSNQSINRAPRGLYSSLIPISAILYAILLALVTSVASAISEIYDLKMDYSTTANPNGVWSYNGGSNRLQYVPNWNGFGPSWTAGGADLAWTRASDLKPSEDWMNGDILVHASDGNSTYGEIWPANVTWTSPVDGVFDIQGGVWQAGNDGRSGIWSVSLNGSVLTSGAVDSGYDHPRANPYDFTSGSGGATALESLGIHEGDVIMFQYDKTTRWGDFVGVNLTITPIPEPSTYAAIMGAAAFGIVWIRRRRNPTRGL